MFSNPVRFRFHLPSSANKLTSLWCTFLFGLTLAAVCRESKCENEDVGGAECQKEIVQITLSGEWKCLCNVGTQIFALKIWFWILWIYVSGSKLIESSKKLIAAQIFDSRASKLLQRVDSLKAVSWKFLHCKLVLTKLINSAFSLFSRLLITNKHFHIRVIFYANLLCITYAQFSSAWQLKLQYLTNKTILW